MVDKAAEKYSCALYLYQISWLSGIGIDLVFIEVFWISKSFRDIVSFLRARLHGFSVRGVLRFFGTVYGLKSHIFYIPDRSEISVHPNFRYGQNHRTEKFSMVQKIHVNAKKFQFGVVVALFIGPTIR